MINIKKNKNVIIIGIVGLVLVVASFFGGMQYEKSTQKTGFASFARSQNGQRGNFTFGQRGGQNGSTGGNRLGGGVIGDVLSVSSDTITVKSQDGSSKIVNITKDTTINKAEAGNIKDISEGTKVAVFGASESDGSINAQSVQINPTMRTAQPK